MPYATLNGCETYYETRGARIPLVFCHGGFGGLGTGLTVEPPAWRDDFAAALLVVTYDRRSAGRSCLGADPHTLDLFADDLASLLDHLGIDDAVIFGTSAGAPIAITFALRYPGRTRALVVTDAAPWFSRDTDLVQRLTDRIALLEREGPAAAYEARRTGGTVGLNLFAAQRPAASREEEEARTRQRDAIQAQLATVTPDDRIARYAAELRTYNAYASFDATEAFATLGMPILVAYATGETLFPDAGWERYATRMPNMEYVTVEGDHGAAARDPGVIERIRAFAAARA